MHKYTTFTGNKVFMIDRFTKHPSTVLSFDFISQAAELFKVWSGISNVVQVPSQVTTTGETR